MEVVGFTLTEETWVSYAKETYMPSFVEESYWVNQVFCQIMDQQSKKACEKMMDYHTKDHSDK